MPSQRCGRGPRYAVSRSRSAHTGTWSDGFSQAAHIAVDADIDQPVAGLRRQQQMIDAQAVVFLPGAGLIIPEGVLAGRVGDGAQRVRQPEAEQRLEAFAGRGAEQGVVDPGRRIMDVLAPPE